jgi:hypothetical protein
LWRFIHIYQIAENMDDLEKEKRRLNDLPGIKLPAMDVGAPKKRKERTKEHCEAISKATKEFYQSEKGEAEKKARSERTKAYWASPEGQAKKERLRQKYKGRNFKNQK